MGVSPIRRRLQPEATGATVEVTKRLKPSVKRATKYGGSASVQAVTRVNAEQASKRTMRTQSLRRGSGDSMYIREARATRETPGRGREDQPDAREGWAGRLGESERFVLPLMPGNAGGGKEPQFKTDATRSEGPEIGQPINSEKCSETADGVTRESEGRSRLSFLRSVRQSMDASRRKMIPLVSAAWDARIYPAC